MIMMLLQVDSFLIDEAGSGTGSDPEPEFLLSRDPDPDQESSQVRHNQIFFVFVQIFFVFVHIFFNVSDFRLLLFPAATRLLIRRLRLGSRLFWRLLASRG